MPAAKGQDVKVWQKLFEELIHEVKPWHHWTLTLDESLVPNRLEPGWTQYQQWVFARFTCSWCSRNWASAHVQVVFHMHWSAKESKGRVKMRAFAQRCQKCSEPPFEVPEFTEDNISRILNNLVFRILKKCYREGFKPMKEIPTVNGVSLEGPHDTHNCEACLQGFCSQSGLDLANVSPPLSLSLPKISSPTFEVPIYKASPTRSSASVSTATGHLGVKKEEARPSRGLSEPPQAKSGVKKETRPSRGLSEPPQAKSGVKKETRPSRGLSEPPQAKSGVKKEEVRPNPWFSAPPQAKGGVKKEEVHPNPWFSAPPQAKGGVKKEEAHPNPWFSAPPQAKGGVKKEEAHPNPWLSAPPQAKGGVKKEEAHPNPWLSAPPQAKGGVKKEEARPNPWLSAPPQAKGGVKKEEARPNPWLSAPPQAASPRANTNYRADHIIQMPPSREVYSHPAQSGRCCSKKARCCLAILILIIVLVVVIVVKTTV